MSLGYCSVCFPCRQSGIYKSGTCFSKSKASGQRIRKTMENALREFVLWDNKSFFEVVAKEKFRTLQNEELVKVSTTVTHFIKISSATLKCWPWTNLNKCDGLAHGILQCYISTQFYSFSYVFSLFSPCCIPPLKEGTYYLNHLVPALFKSIHHICVAASLELWWAFCFPNH